MPGDGSKRPRGKPKVKIGGVNKGTNGRQGATRIWVGGVGAANGGYRGKFLEFLERIQHALTMHKAWGGGFKMPSAHAADLFMNYTRHPGNESESCIGIHIYNRTVI